MQLATILVIKTPKKTHTFTLPVLMDLYEVREYARVFLGVQRPSPDVEIRNDTATVVYPS